MKYRFRPPTVDEGPMGTGSLFSRYRQSRGISLLVTGSTVTQVRWPTMDELAAADTYYLGGHEYEIDAAAAAVLTAAGYEPTLIQTRGYTRFYERDYDPAIITASTPRRYGATYAGSY